MAIFSRHCPFSDGVNHQGQCQKIAKDEAIFREIDQAVISVVLEDIEESGFTAKGCKFRQLKGKLK